MTQDNSRSFEIVFKKQGSFFLSEYSLQVLKQGIVKKVLIFYYFVVVFVEELRFSAF